MYKTATFCQPEGKNSRKIQNSRPKLNDFDTKTQGTGGFYHLRPLENRTKKPELAAKCCLPGLDIDGWKDFCQS